MTVIWRFSSRRIVVVIKDGGAVTCWDLLKVEEIVQCVCVHKEQTETEEEGTEKH